MNKHILFLLLSSVLLTACGGGGSSSSNNGGDDLGDPGVFSIKSQDIADNALISQTYTVDLKNHVTTKADSFTLSQAQLISQDPNCQIVGVQSQSFDIVAQNVSACTVQYTVDNGSSTDESIARVSFAKTSQETTAPPLSAVTDVNSPVVIDLSSIIPTTYVLDDSYTLIGTGSAVMHTATNTITYTPSETGATRLLTSATDVDNDAIIMLTVDIAISDTIYNQPPVALDFIYDDVIPKGSESTIDVADYISDPDNSDLEPNTNSLSLVYVHAYNAETEITSDSDTTFTYTPSTPGKTYVSYTIHDGLGGYNTGIIEINVEADFTIIQDWEDIIIKDPLIETNITFLAPVTKSFADYTSISYNDSTTEDGTQGPRNSQVVAMTFDQAEHYCRNRNARLPITRELNLLSSITEGVYQSDNWPASREYWSYDKLSITSANAQNLLTGTNREISNDNAEITDNSAYVTCVSLNDSAIKDFRLSEIVKTDNEDNVYNIKLSTNIIDPDGTEAPYQKITIESLANQAGFGESNLDASIQGYADETGNIIESYNFTVSDKDLISASFSENIDPTIQQVDLKYVGFDATDRDKWNYALVSRTGSNTLATFDPLISSDHGALILPGSGSNSLNAIATQWIRGSNVDISFKIYKSNKLSGQVNVILQQVSPVSPNVYDDCDPDAFGGVCEWYEAGANGSVGALTSGVPLADNRWINFGFNIYNKLLRLSMGGEYDLDSNDNSYDIIEEEAVNDPNGKLTTSYYRISITNGQVSMYSSSDGINFGSALISMDLGDIQINTDQFYWIGLSGGTITTSGVKHYVDDLKVTYY